MNGHIDIVRLLIEANADLNLPDEVYTLLYLLRLLCSRTVEYVSCLVGTMLVSPTCDKHEPQFIRCSVITRHNYME